MYLIDSHCHIHDEDFPIETDQVLLNARSNSVTKVICIGVDLQDSIRALEFAKNNSSPDNQLFASVGIHPHEASTFTQDTIAELKKLAADELVVAIGEIGLDYHYNNSLIEVQKHALRQQLRLAQNLNLPVSFHVREAYDDFWQIFDDCVQSGGKIRGVMHSFTDSLDNLNKALDSGLFIGVNGISTFVKKPDEVKMFSSIPLNRILLETDAPFLSPTGKRGKPNHPANVKLIAGDLAAKRGLPLLDVARITSRNTQKLFNI